MATSLFKMPFDVDRLRLTRVYESPELSRCQAETMSCDKIRQIYGDLKFLELHQDRPCTYTSLVTSIDGRIAFTDVPQGPLIAKKNKYDPAGADADWFILNMLRAVSDGVMLGAGTMNAESDYTCHVFDQDMEDMRVENGRPPVPWNIVTSLDAADIPFGHVLFNTPEVPVMISTSRKGLALVRETWGAPPAAWRSPAGRPSPMSSSPGCRPPRARCWPSAPATPPPTPKRPCTC